MSNKRYLEIDSTYRNREQYPNPSNFTVLISQSGTRDPSHAFDPVSDASPIETWVPNNLVLTTVSVQPANTNTTSEFIVNVAKTENASRNPDYYSGYPVTINGQKVNIVKWSYTSSSSTVDSFIVTIFPPTVTTPSGGVAFSTATTVNFLDQGIIFIPDGYTADSYYTNLIVYNETVASSNVQNSWRTIISYDGSSKLAGFDNTNPVNSGGDPWALDHTLSIRKKPPKYVGTLVTPTGTQPTNTTSSFTVPPETIVNIGDFIRFTGTTYTDISYRVTNYTGEGQEANIEKMIPKIYPNIVTVDRVLSIVPPNDETFEVLAYSYDNAVPFSYNGSLVSQQEMVCYEIELVNLILPNKILVSGGLTAFYPYLHVELQNVSASSAGNINIIYSNNPSTRKMLFRAPITDIPTPTISPFIKIDGDGMVQTVKFKPNDNLKFGVYLPNGDELTTVDRDTNSPSAPDPLVQISAMFSIKRL